MLNFFVLPEQIGKSSVLRIVTIIDLRRARAGHSWLDSGFVVRTKSQSK